MKLIFLVVIFVTTLLAQEQTYVLTHSGLVDNRAYDKINAIGNEVKNKLNIGVYLDVKGNNGIDINLDRKDRLIMMKTKEIDIINQIKDITDIDFIVLSISLDQKYASILFSNENLKKLIDKDDILNGYVIPLLAAKDKNTLKSKVSAAVLNGYAEIGDELAEHNDIKLKSSIGSQGKTASSIWRVFIYTIVLFGIIAYVFIILRERKYKKDE